MHPVDDDEPLDLDPSMLHPEVDFEKGIALFPPVTALLMLACIICFAGQVSQNALDNLDNIVECGALSRPEVERGEVWRLVSAMFLHGGAEHLFGNLVMLYILGMACEHGFGRPQFIILYVTAGVCGSCCSLLSNQVSVGASGAIFGLAGGIIVFFWRHRHRLHLRDKRIGFVLAIWALYQFSLGWLMPEIDNFAHLGGLVSGALLGLLLRPALLDGKAEVASHPLTVALTLGSMSILGIAFGHLFSRLFG